MVSAWFGICFFVSVWFGFWLFGLRMVGILLCLGMVWILVLWSPHGLDFALSRYGLDFGFWSPHGLDFVFVSVWFGFWFLSRHGLDFGFWPERGLERVSAERGFQVPDRACGP